MTAPALHLDHVAFDVADADASRRFYGETLGLPLVSTLSGDDWDGSPWLMLCFALADGRQLVLTHLRGAPPRPPPTGPADVRHLAFAVDTLADLDAWRDRLRAAGLSPRDEDHGTQRSLYFTDPDGSTLEITTPPSRMGSLSTLPGS